jgi:hypothetical protein
MNLIPQLLLQNPKHTSKCNRQDKEYNRQGVQGVLILRQVLIEHSQLLTSPSHSPPNVRRALPQRPPDVRVLSQQALPHYIPAPLPELHRHLRRRLHKLGYMIRQALRRRNLPSGVVSITARRHFSSARF